MTIYIKEQQFEAYNGLNKPLTRKYILEVYKRTHHKTYRGKNYSIIFNKRDGLSFTGKIINNKTKKEYKFSYNYTTNNFIFK